MKLARCNDHKYGKAKKIISDREYRIMENNEAEQKIEKEDLQVTKVYLENTMITSDIITFIS